MIWLLYYIIQERQNTGAWLYKQVKKIDRDKNGTLELGGGAVKCRQ